MKEFKLDTCFSKEFAERYALVFKDALVEQVVSVVQTSPEIWEVRLSVPEDRHWTGFMQEEGSEDFLTQNLVDIISMVALHSMGETNK